MKLLPVDEFGNCKAKHKVRYLEPTKTTVELTCSATDCCNKCKQETQCNAWTWQVSDLKCHLKFIPGQPDTWHTESDDTAVSGHFTGMHREKHYSVLVRSLPHIGAPI